MNIVIFAEWWNSGFGYIIGKIVVKDENGKILMQDEDMYYNFGKFIDFIVKKFRYNPRFEWKRMILHKSKQILEMRAFDKKGAYNKNAN